jgi:hypothetical protein
VTPASLPFTIEAFSRPEVTQLLWNGRSVPSKPNATAATPGEKQKAHAMGLTVEVYWLQERLRLMPWKPWLREKHAKMVLNFEPQLIVQI